MPPSTVHVVHCIDTEGPLGETLEATFQRLYSIYGIELPATAENLKKLQNKDFDLGGIEAAVAKTFAPELLSYNDTWEKIDAMLDILMSADFRNQYKDSFGNGWIYNWFLLDHVGFIDNPRNRDLGFDKVWQHYVNRVATPDSAQDGIHFHHHPLPFSRAANHCATHWFANQPIIFDILSRKVIDHHWFPSAFRPGFHTIRPDSHWFLEQYIPFDYSNQRAMDNELEGAQKDIAQGRYGDWRRAPLTWTPYHPSHDDYQIPGHCRRWTARCLNVGTRLRLLSQEDVDLAFQEAQSGQPVLLSFTNHDYREMKGDISYVANLVQTSAQKHPDVPYRWCEAREGMRSALQLPELPKITAEQSIKDNVLRITLNHNSFGPQPYLAIKTKSGHYFHDNMDTQTPMREWTYMFDENTLLLENVEAIGWAVNDAFGNTAVGKIIPNSEESTVYNL